MTDFKQTDIDINYQILFFALIGINKDEDHINCSETWINPKIINKEVNKYYNKCNLLSIAQNVRKLLTSRKLLYRQQW